MSLMPPSFPSLVTTLQTAARDTVVAVPVRDGLATVESVAVIVLGLAVVAMFFLFLRVTLEMKDLESKVRSLVARIDERLEPVTERAANVAENVDFVSRVVREDVERLSISVQRMGDRLNQASDRMEERIDEFNALMELVQSEAEDIFIDTASTVRGVREGTRAIRDGRGSGASAAPGEEAPEPPHPERKPVEEGELPDVEADLPRSEG